MNQEFLLGYARTNISPKEPCPLSGFGSGKNRISARVMDELYFSCIALTDWEGSTALVCSIDHQRPQEEVIRELRDAMTEATGIPGDRILISATHTHSTPDLYMTFFPAIVNYRKLLQEQSAKAAVAALADRKPATFAVGSMETKRLNFVKHYRLENGSVVGDNFGNPKESPYKGHVSDAYSIMHSIRVKREGCKDLVITNFRSHPTMTGGTNKLEVSSDYVGPFRDSMEKQMDCDFVYFQGACGNINPKSRLQDENLTRDYMAYGALLAEANIKILQKNMREVPAGKLQMRQINYDCPIDHSRDHLKDKAQEVVDYWHSTAPDYDKPGTKQRAVAYGFSSIYDAMGVIGKTKLAPSENCELDVVTIGDQMAFVSAPGELWDSVSVEMERRSPFPMSMTLGYANGDRKYFPHGLGCTYRSYESDYARLVLGTADKVIDIWTEALVEMYKNS